jgi:hypothetical protein
MAKLFPKAAYKGKVKIGAVTVAGSATWSYSGDVRNMIPADEFGDEIITHVPGQIEGGEVTITGNFLIEQDAGQQLLKTRFDAGTQITDLYLYISETDSVYMMPDDTSTPASFATVTNYNNVTHEKSGVGTFTCTLKVSGVLKPVY